MKNNRLWVGIDIGGSHISCGLVSSNDCIIKLENEYEISLDSIHSTSAFINDLQSVIKRVIVSKGKENISGIGIAMPGPFDYARGISKIPANLQKLNNLYGINLTRAVRSIFDENEKPVVFVNDATCFALGEYFGGAAKESKRCILVTLGTGFGSTFLNEGMPQTVGDEVPENGYLYNILYKDSIADDYFSTRWFVKQWKHRTGEDIGGVKDLVQYAKVYHPVALAIFDDFAVQLAEFMAPWLVGFDADAFILGGNIAKAFDLFGDRLKSEFQKKGLNNLQVRASILFEKAPVIGAAMYVKREFENLKMKQLKEIRKTTQLLAPSKATPTFVGDYDIYPAFPVGNGKINSGMKALAESILHHKIVVIDGYEGIFWDELVKQLDTELTRLGKTTRWFHSDAAMKESGEILSMIQPYLGEESSIFGKITDKKLEDWFYIDQLQQIKPDVDADINILIGCGSTLAGWKNAFLVYVDIPKNELQFRMRAGSAMNLGAESSDDMRIMYKRSYFVDWIVLNNHKCRILPEIDMIIDEQRAPDQYLFMMGDDLRKGLSEMSRNLFRVRPWFEPGPWGGNWMKNHIEGLNKEVDNLAWSFELMVLENGLMFESDDYRLEVSFDFLMFNNYKEVLGDCADRFKYDFPIRFDYLDTFDGGNLSIQCHPRPEYIKNEFGMPFTQDETYYIMDCKNDPHVYLGFQEGVDPKEFHQALIQSQEQVTELDVDKYVRKFPVKKHDLFLMPNGTIHASGKDSLVLEISSAPYIFTFKMYDWLRLDLDGRPRAINIEHAMKNLYFERQGKTVEDELISKPSIIEQTDECIIEHLPTHPSHFYDVYRYNFDKELFMETKNKCHVWMLVEGEFVDIETENGMSQRFNFAETFVIPAAAKSYKIINKGKSKALMVQAFVK